MANARAAEKKAQLLIEKNNKRRMLLGSDLETGMKFSNTPTQTLQASGYVEVKLVNGDLLPKLFERAGA